MELELELEMEHFVPTEYKRSLKTKMRKSHAFTTTRTTC